MVILRAPELDEVGKLRDIQGNIASVGMALVLGGRAGTVTETEARPMPIFRGFPLFERGLQGITRGHFPIGLVECSAVTEDVLEKSWGCSCTPYSVV
jgi:hypothetical protein